MTAKTVPNPGYDSKEWVTILFKLLNSHQIMYYKQNYIESMIDFSMCLDMCFENNAPFLYRRSIPKYFKSRKRGGINSMTESS